MPGTDIGQKAKVDSIARTGQFADQREGRSSTQGGGRQRQILYRGASTSTVPNRACGLKVRQSGQTCRYSATCPRTIVSCNLASSDFASPSERPTSSAVAASTGRVMRTNLIDSPMQILPLSPDPHIGPIHLPTAAYPTLPHAKCLLQHRHILEHPVGSDWSFDLHSTLAHRLLELAVTDRIRHTPAYIPEDDLPLKMAAFTSDPPRHSPLPDRSGSCRGQE
jgi:hypothetical protein